MLWRIYLKREVLKEEVVRHNLRLGLNHLESDPWTEPQRSGQVKKVQFGEYDETANII